MVGTAKPPDSQCWGDMLRSIDAERRTLPWKSSDFIPGHTISLAEVSPTSSQELLYFKQAQVFIQYNENFTAEAERARC